MMLVLLCGLRIIRSGAFLVFSVECCFEKLVGNADIERMEKFEGTIHRYLIMAREKQLSDSRSQQEESMKFEPVQKKDKLNRMG